MKKRDWKAVFMMVWDPFCSFLILCFVILITTMLVTKSADSTEFTGYTVNIPLLAGVVISLAAYLGFMLSKSLKSLRALVDKYFCEKKGDDGEVDG